MLYTLTFLGSKPVWLVNYHQHEVVTKVFLLNEVIKQRDGYNAEDAYRLLDLIKNVNKTYKSHTYQTQDFLENN